MFKIIVLAAVVLAAEAAHLGAASQVLPNHYGYGIDHSAPGYGLGVSTSYVNSNSLSVNPVPVVPVASNLRKYGPTLGPNGVLGSRYGLPWNPLIAPGPGYDPTYGPGISYGADLAYPVEPDYDQVPGYGYAGYGGYGPRQGYGPGYGYGWL